MIACELVGVTKSFGALRAADDVSLAIAAGSLTCLIGPNGAGKSTLLGCISGFHRVDAGVVRVGGKEITQWPPHRRARHGLATVFQTTRALEQLDVLDNAAVGATCDPGAASSRACCAFRGRDGRSGACGTRPARRSSSSAWTTWPPRPQPSFRSGSCDCSRSRARSRSSRPCSCWTSRPRACAPVRRRSLIEALQTLPARGLTLVLVEHDMQFVGALADRVVVLDRGRVIADGMPSEVRSDPG